MKIRNLAFILIVLGLLFLCTGCSSEVSMPYGSAEYEGQEWSVEELVEHFKELGFSEIKTDVIETFDKDQARICRVAIEDIFSDSWTMGYKDFEKGESIGTHLEVFISAYTLIPTLTVDNCVEFADLVKMDNENPEKADLLASFMQTHDGEFLEFDGTITDWQDKYFWVGVSFTTAVENSTHMFFSWDSIGLIDLGMTGDYHYNKYHSGLITEGMNIHMLAKIDWLENEWSLEIDSMEIIE
jgi:hypothetical protein